MRSNVAPLIFNAGASYRFDHWRWPVEFGGSVRHVGDRFVFEDDATTMNGYTTADVYTFVDLDELPIGRALVGFAHVSSRPRHPKTGARKSSRLLRNFPERAAQAIAGKGIAPRLRWRSASRTKCGSAEERPGLSVGQEGEA
jgi:hypothetical protein